MRHERSFPSERSVSFPVRPAVRHRSAAMNTDRNVTVQSRVYQQASLAELRDYLDWLDDQWLPGVSPQPVPDPPPSVARRPLLQVLEGGRRQSDGQAHARGSLAIAPAARARRRAGTSHEPERAS